MKHGWYIIGGYHHGERHPQRCGESLRLAEQPERARVAVRPGEAVDEITLKCHDYRLVRFRSGVKEYPVWVPISVPEGEEMAHLIETAARPTDRVTRFEVIDEGGRAYARDPRSPDDWPIQVCLSFQDEGRTLKAFVERREGS